VLEIHVLLSLIGIGTGLVVLCGMLKAQHLSGWTEAFLVATALTCLTGFPLPHVRVPLPSDIVGVIVLIALTLASVALYGYRLAGAWRRVYVVTAVLALYLNVFVGVVQAFDKVPTLRPFGLPQPKAPFVVAQFLVLGLFVGLGVVAMRRFRPPTR
jgi:hypothetical protein